MDNYKFKVGDRVEILDSKPEKHRIGQTGKIVIINGSEKMDCYGVEFKDKDYRDYDLRGNCEEGYGSWFYVNEIRIFKPKLKKFLEEFKNEI